jgi:hypothetical protein
MSESKSNITPITKRQREPDRAPAQLFERMIALLDQAEDAREARRLQDQDHDLDGRVPNGHNAEPMHIGISNNENFVPIIPEADRDRAAVEEEDVFRRRFGFAWPYPYRQALIDLKHKRGLSDREIWWLYHSGSLRRQENGVQFKASWIMAIVGCIAIAALMSQHALVALRIASIPALTWTQSFVAVLLMSGVLAVQSGVYRAFVEPWRIYRRRSK